MALAVFLTVVGTVLLFTAGWLSFIGLKAFQQLVLFAQLAETNIDILNQLKMQQDMAMMGEEEGGSQGFGLNQ